MGLGARHSCKKKGDIGDHGGAKRLKKLGFFQVFFLLSIPFLSSSPSRHEALAQTQ